MNFINEEMILVDCWGHSFRPKAQRENDVVDFNYLSLARHLRERIRREVKSGIWSTPGPDAVKSSTVESTSERGRSRGVMNLDLGSDNRSRLMRDEDEPRLRHKGDFKDDHHRKRGRSPRRSPSRLNRTRLPESHHGRAAPNISWKRSGTRRKGSRSRSRDTWNQHHRRRDSRSLSPLRASRLVSGPGYSGEVSAARDGHPWSVSTYTSKRVPMTRPSPSLSPTSPASPHMRSDTLRPSAGEVNERQGSPVK